MDANSSRAAEAVRQGNPKLDATRREQLKQFDKETWSWTQLIETAEAVRQGTWSELNAIHREQLKQ
ncbi:unnamed protein product [Heligmosomoides polygyrus]|uniref:Uncharacterized protein n=1 Tax=Heligmosomoides polygyrus TaxID=6339 RepID=A0A3P8IYG2_HELPZ|nr:unnamed protein product [Heligmosomoides polygyrus]